jgi:hypothetical protein
MAITALFPELILFKAICELHLALDDLRRLDEHLAASGLDRKLVSMEGELALPSGTSTIRYDWSVGYGPFGGLLSTSWISNVQHPQRLTVGSLPRDSCDVESGYCQASPFRPPNCMTILFDNSSTARRRCACGAECRTES